MSVDVETRWPVAVLLLAMACAACVDTGADHHDETPMDEATGVRRSAVTLGSLGAGCSTAGTEGLGTQLLEEMLCLTDGRFVRFSHPRITLTSSRVHPYLSPEAAAAIESVAEGGTPLRINSAFRTLAEQYVLWLGCPVAAAPGGSNHESGRAVDVDNWSAARSALVAAGFSHPLPSSDPVHFEGPGDDLRSFSVLAFQRLWNANHPEDPIDEDGISGPQTRARLERSPAEGFRVGRVCEAGPPPLEAEAVSQGAHAESAAEGADFRVCAGLEVAFWVELRNTGGATWVDDGAEGGESWGGAVRLGVPTDTSDPLVGLARVSVTSSSNPEVRPDGPDCNDAPGCARTIFTLTGRAPDDEGTVRSTWQLVDEMRAWFGPEMTITFLVEACETPPQPPGDDGADGPASSDDPDDHVPAPESSDPGGTTAEDRRDLPSGLTGGCSATAGRSGAGRLSPVLALLLGWRRLSLYAATTPSRSGRSLPSARSTSQSSAL